MEEKKEHQTALDNQVPGCLPHRCFHRHQLLAEGETQVTGTTEPPSAKALCLGHHDCDKISKLTCRRPSVSACERAFVCTYVIG